MAILHTCSFMCQISGLLIFNQILIDPSEDDFFLIGSSSDADDEWTDKSTRYLLVFVVYYFS